MNKNRSIYRNKIREINLWRFPEKCRSHLTKVTKTDIYWIILIICQAFSMLNGKRSTESEHSRSLTEIIHCFSNFVERPLELYSHTNKLSYLWQIIRFVPYCVKWTRKLIWIINQTSSCKFKRQPEELVFVKIILL